MPFKAIFLYPSPWERRLSMAFFCSNVMYDTSHFSIHITSVPLLSLIGIIEKGAA